MRWKSSGLRKRRVLVSGILSPLVGPVLYSLVYVALSSRSANLEQDWLFRLSWSTAAMTLPFFATLALAVSDYRRKALSLSGKLGLGIAVLSLSLTGKPVSDGILRAKQSRNMAMRDVSAPLFDTPDILGREQRLRDHAGQVVLVNIWATWCGPCRGEMPRLDALYREWKDRGFMVFGLSDEDIDVQKKYAAQVGVSYPLLTVHGKVPSLYRDISRYPAMFLIDRRGRLQPAPDPEQPFQALEKEVDSLLSANLR